VLFRKSNLTLSRFPEDTKKIFDDTKGELTGWFLFLFIFLNAKFLFSTRIFQESEEVNQYIDSYEACFFSG